MKLRRFLPELLAGGVSALLLLALWVGPHLLNWERYREGLAALASSQLGRPVSLDGAITLTLLPQPRVQAAAVVIGPGEDGLRVTARALRLRLALWPLLAGRLVPREFGLLGGDIHLPWPPEPGALHPPAWLSGLDARLEDSRLVLGTLALEGLNARLATAADGTLEAEAAMAWRGQPLRLNARLGLEGGEGANPLSLSLAGAGATLQLQGALGPDGNFHGRMEAAGPDLAALLPSPPGAFRLSGPLRTAPEQLGGEGLALDFAGQPGELDLLLRLAPEPRLELAFKAPRLELEPWLATLGAPRAQALPLSLTLAVERARFGALALQDLRATLHTGAERLTIAEAQARLPGGAVLEASGLGTGRRLDLALRFNAPVAEETLAMLGLALPPGPHQAEGRLRLAMEAGEVALSEINASLDGARFTGDAVWRPGRDGARPRLNLGLAVDRLALDGLLPEAASLPGFDFNLRLAATELRWRGLQAPQAMLDAGLENGRLTLRRLALRLGELDLLARGTLLPGPQPRLVDVVLEANGPDASVLAPLLPLPPGLLARPLALRLTGAGPAEALALRGDADFGEMRLEAGGTLDSGAWRGQGWASLRHPNAVRLLGEDAGWLGPGSLSAMATLVLSPHLVMAEPLDLVAGSLRTRGSVVLGLHGAGPGRPRLVGRLMAETLPLPPLEPLPSLDFWDLDLTLEAARLAWAGETVLQQAAGRILLADRKLRLVGVQGRLAGGTLEAGLSLDASTTPAQLEVQARLADAMVVPPLLDLPFDLTAGRLEGQVRLTASGPDRAALLASLGGEASLTVRDGMLRGLDLRALVVAAGVEDARMAEAGMAQAMLGGATAFERLDAVGRLAAGRLRLEGLRVAAENFGASTAEGEVDLPRGLLDVRLLARPMTEAPDVRLRLTGPLQAPRRVVESADFLRGRMRR